MTRSVFLVVPLCFFGCATVPKGDVDLLKPTIEAFHQAARWKDFQAIGELLVPEKKDAFMNAGKDLKDEKNLYITDYELQDAKVALDLLKEPEPDLTNQVRCISALFSMHAGMFILKDGVSDPEEKRKIIGRGSFDRVTQPHSGPVSP